MLSSPIFQAAAKEGKVAKRLAVLNLDDPS